MWEKKGLLFECPFEGTGFAQDAFIDVIDNKTWRIYYSTRKKTSSGYISYPYYVDVEAGCLNNIIKIGKEPLFLPGRPGCFDDCGITMTSIVKIDEHTKYLYYCGWNQKTTVSYSLAIGCVKVVDNTTYTKLYEGPIMERSIYNPIAVSAPMVIKDDNMYKMWYISFLSWDLYGEKREPIYVVKMATSEDGVNWACDDHICIDMDYPGEAVGRPWVIKDNNIYRMWFSTRGIEDYRTKNGRHYTIGYAESDDGITWVRRPDKFEFIPSEEGWDCEMQEYASVKKHDGKYYMLYNGNEFGKTGFGYAVEE